MHYLGRGVTKDTYQAATLFKTAADMGERYGQYNLATQLEVGDGVEQNLPLAAE